MPKAVIVFGSNINPQKYVPEAIRRLGKVVHILAISPVYRTPPVGASGSPSYWNGALLIETEISPRELRDRVLRGIEAALGRVRTPDPNAARTIDLDLVLYQGVHSDTSGILLPSPDLWHYAHVAIPVADIVPDWPLNGETVADVARRLREQARAFEVIHVDIPLPPGSHEGWLTRKTAQPDPTRGHLDRRRS